jgi:hypothetical protein
VIRAICLLVVGAAVSACGAPPAADPSPAPGPVDGARNGSFALEIRTPRDHYAAAEAIPIATTIVYRGPRDQIVASSAYSSLVTFGLEQVDGPLDMPGGSDLMCRTLGMTARQPLAVGFVKSGGYIPSEPTGDFWGAYFADKQLHLPAGTWRVTASLRAWTTPDCSGRRESLDTAVTFVVE